MTCYVTQRNPFDPAVTPITEDEIAQVMKHAPNSVFLRQAAMANVDLENWQGPVEQPPFVYDPKLGGYVLNPLSPRRAR